MQRSEDTSRIKRGKDEDRFYCPYPGCTRSFAELWRLKVHYRAPPDVRGSGKERGHGTELQFCPKCGKELKPGKHHVGCFAGRAGPKPLTKRAREAEPDIEHNEQAEASNKSARQRTRTGALPDIKFEDVLPRAGSLNQFSEEAASLTSGWHGEQAATESVSLAQDLHTQAQQRPAESDLLEAKATDQFFSYQQTLPSLRHPHRSLLGLPSGPSPPPSPPGDIDPEVANIPPLFDFNLFNPDRIRGRNMRLPVAVTSTLHTPSDTADDMVLQAILGDATSFAASGANQLASAATRERQQLQNTLAHHRIEQVAASAQELLRFQGPALPHAASQYSNHFPSPPQNLPNRLGDLSSMDSSLASLLQQPNQLVSTLEHYEAPGSGRPGRMHGQQQSRFTSPQSSNWVHKPVPTRRQSDLGSGLSPLPSPPALLNTQQRPHTPGSLQSLLPWDFNRWGGLPTDIEANVAQGFRLREQQQAQAQQQQQQQQQLSGAAPAPHTSDSEFRQQIQDYSFLHRSSQAHELHSAYNQLDSPFHYTLPNATAAMPQADAYGFSEAFNSDGGSEALMPYPRRLMRQDVPPQDMLTDRQPLLPWGVQESGLFDSMAGISPGPAVSFGNSALDTSMGLSMHGRYPGEQTPSVPPGLLASPEAQLGGGGGNALSNWPQSAGRGVLERGGQSPHQASEHTQGVPQASLGAYDDHLWSGQGPSHQLPPATRN